MTRAMRFAVLAAGLGLGVFSMAVARGGAGYSFGGSSAFAGAAELVAGYALLAVGFTAWMRPRQARLGAILVAASFAWFLLEWSNPAAGSVVFTTGLVLYAAAPPLVAHAMLAYPDGRVGWWPGRLGLALGYAARCSCSACSPPLSSIPVPRAVRSARATCCSPAAAAVLTGASAGPGCTWV